MQTDWPKISIVMPSYNQAGQIGAAIESAVSQDYANKEVIVIDAGSTDGSVDIIRSYEDQLTYWVSEPDEGQSDAMNKGLHRAAGEWLTWLNTDDILLPDVLKKIGEEGVAHPKCEWITGNTILIDSSDRIFKCSRNLGCSSLLWRMGAIGLGSPSSFFKRSLYERTGDIRVDLHLRMDGDLWCRFFKAGARFRRIREYLWCFRWHSGGKTTKELFDESNTMDLSKLGTSEKQKESNIVLQEHLSDLSPIKARLGRLGSAARKILSGQYLAARRDTRLWGGKKWQDVFLPVATRGDTE